MCEARAPLRYNSMGDGMSHGMCASPASNKHPQLQPVAPLPTPLTSQPACNVGGNPRSPVVPCKNAAAAHISSWWQGSGIVLERVLFERPCPRTVLDTRQLTIEHAGAGGSRAGVDGGVQVALQGWKQRRTSWRSGWQMSESLLRVQMQWRHCNYRCKRSRLQMPRNPVTQPLSPQHMYEPP